MDAMEIVEKLNPPDLAEEINTGNSFSDADIIDKNQSRANIKLKEMESKIQSAEKMYSFIKNRLDFIKDVYQNVGPTECKKYNIHNDSSSVRSQNLSINDSQSLTLSPENNDDDDDDDDKQESTISVDEDTLKNIEEYSSSVDSVRSSCREKKQLSEDELSDNSYDNFEQSEEILYPEEILQPEEMLQSDEILQPEEILRSDEIPLSDEIFESFVPTTKNDKKTQLILNFNDVCRELSRRRELTKFENVPNIVPLLDLGSHKTQSRKLEENLPRKVKQRKTKLSQINPKNNQVNNRALLTAKITHPKTYVKQEPIKIRSTPNDDQIKMEEITKNKSNKNIVEIYHNMAINTSPSAVSSKQYFDLENNTINLQDDKETIESSQEKLENYIELLHLKNSKDKSCDEDIRNIISRQKQQSNVSRVGHNVDPDLAQFHSNYSEKAADRNYLQPTIASKLKNVNKDGYSIKSDVKNTPFVAGTSISPSHNLRLNTQQSEIINKINDPVAPIQSEFEDFYNCPDTSLTQVKQMFYKNTCKSDDDVKIKNKICDNLTEKMPIKSDILKTLDELIVNNFADTEMFGEVTTKLCAEFGILSRKSDNLREQLGKSYDAKLKKELTETESELNEKEKIMNVMVSLYLQVIELKRQVRSQNKNNLIHVTNNSNKKSKKSHSSNIERSRTVNNLQAPHHHPKIKSSVSSKMPQTSASLVALLHQIQSD